MKARRSKTAGKRTSRPGSKTADSRAQRTVGRAKTYPPAGGKRTVRVTARHINAHRRAAAQRKHNPKSK